MAMLFFIYSLVGKRAVYMFFDLICCLQNASVFLLLIRQCEDLPNPSTNFLAVAIMWYFDFGIPHLFDLIFYSHGNTNEINPDWIDKIINQLSDEVYQFTLFYSKSF